MKTYSPDAQAALDEGRAVAHGALRLDLTTGPWRVWGGYGDLVLDGETYVGLGNQGLVAVAAGQLGTAEQGAELMLSGVDTTVLALVDTLAVRGAAAVVWELLFDHAWTLLSANVALRGRCDRLTREDVVGGPSVIRLMVEGAVRGLGRRSGRMRSDADQRLIAGEDGGFSRISYAGEKQLYWGGKPPARAAAALPNASMYAGTRYLGEVAR